MAEEADLSTSTSAAAAPNPWRVGVPLVLVIAGMLFAITATTARGTNLRSGENLRLVDLIQAAELRNDRTRLAGERLAAEVESLAAQAADPQVKQVRQQAQAIAGAAGLTALTGPGLTVTLDDAPTGALEAEYPGLPAPTPDDLVVHQQDLQAVVNALWAAGADAIQLMDQRIVSTSAVRCVGNVLILQDRVYSPPYVVTAIGDVPRMAEALDATSAISDYREYVADYGLTYEVDTQNRITVPAFAGSLDLRYAKVDG